MSPDCNIRIIVGVEAIRLSLSRIFLCQLTNCYSLQ